MQNFDTRSDSKFICAKSREIKYFAKLPQKCYQICLAKHCFTKFFRLLFFKRVSPEIFGDRLLLKPLQVLKFCKQIKSGLITIIFYKYYCYCGTASAGQHAGERCAECHWPQAEEPLLPTQGESP